MTDQGIGARLLRKEDDRFLRGKGQYVGDIRLPGMKEVAFLRSPVAHARIRGFEVAEERRRRVFTMDDLEGVKPIRAVAALPGFKVSEQWPLARDKVRHVGELLAMCLADTRAEAEDLAAMVAIELDELPAVTDMLAARRPEAPRLHEHWSDNVYLSTRVDGDVERIASIAAVVVRRQLRMNRQCQAPLEGKGLVAWWDSRLEQLVVYSATQLQRSRRMSRPRGGKATRRRPRCRRRVRLQERAAARGDRGRLAGSALRPSGTLARGPARAPHRRGECARAFL